MSQTINLPSKRGEPVWELAQLYPDQGFWSETDYLFLETSRLVEFTDGYVEMLPMPSQSHQFIVLFLYQLLKNFIRKSDLGTLLVAPLRVRLKKGSYREPDIVFVLQEHNARRHEQYWDGADLVMEVVSPDDPQRDTVRKRIEYAEAGIPEYWIVNPIDEMITVLTLVGETYAEHGVFGRGQLASSVLLAGFEADVAAVFDAPE